MIVRFGLLLLVSALGCTRVGSGARTGGEGGTRKVEPWPTVSSELARRPDATGVRRAIVQLNGELETLGEALPPLPAEALAKLTAKLPPSEDEARDWKSGVFTLMDANYVNECLFLHTAAKSLELDGLNDEAKGNAAFDWICRQMYLRPWLLNNNPMPPVPPPDVLRRGFGTGLERAYAFLALCRQIGLQGVLLGPPGCEARPGADPRTTNTRGPFWAVGVKIGDDVLLYDPWIGEAIPAANGTARLSAAKANLSFVTTWWESKKNAFPVKSEDVFNSVAYVTAPMNALTPRMMLLEARLANEVGVKLAVDAEAIDAACRNLPGGPAKWFAPPMNVDPYSPPHILGAFTPKDDGGYDPSPPKQQLAAIHNQYAGLPLNPSIPPVELAFPEARQQFVSLSLMQYAQQLIEPGYHDRLIRGQHAEVVKQLVDLESSFSRLRDRRRNPEAANALVLWYAKANEAFDRYRRAQIPANAAEQPGAEADLKALWGGNSAGTLAVQGCAAETGTHEIAFLLAMCKHEQAEISQVRRFKTTTPATIAQAQNDWQVAVDAWARYRQTAAQYDAAFPNRAAHAAKLAERAAKLANS